MEIEETKEKKMMGSKLLRFEFSAEKKVVELADRFEELKKSGRLTKHMEKYRKKILAKDRRKMDAGPSFR